MAAQKALDVTGHNIANADTPGYTRQRLTTYAISPDSGSGVFASVVKGQIGSGVEIESVTQIRDEFLDRQYWNESTSLARWTVKSDVLQYMEDILNEPSDESLSGVVGEFFNKLQELVNNPESKEIRTLVRQNAVIVTDILHHYSAQMQELRNQQDYSIRVDVGQVNSYAQKIAALNEEIFRFELSGEKANDLRDRRNLLLDQLSELVDIGVREDSQGRVSVTIGGTKLVDYNQVNELALVDKPDGTADILWSHDSSPVVIRSGRLMGYLEMRDGVGPNTTGQNPALGIPYYMQQLDDFAAAFIQEFNETNAMGKLSDGITPGTVLFTGSTAADIEISQEWKEDVFVITTSSTGAPADNSNAIRFAALRDKQTSIGIFEEHIASIVSDLAVNASYSKDMMSNGYILLNAVNNHRLSVSGVSLDEEMANMVKYQQTYAAAARMMTAIDEALDILINRTGLVGR